MIFRLFPGGCTLISMPQLRISSGSSSSKVALPLYGVTMQEQGVTRVLTINLNDVERELNIK